MQTAKTNGAPPWVFPLTFASDISKGGKGGQDLFTPSSSIAICRLLASTEGEFLESGGRLSAWDACGDKFNLIVNDKIFPCV